MVDFWIPEESSGEIVTVDGLESPPVYHGVQTWRALRAGRRYPDDPHALLAEVSDHAFLVEILEDDYRYGRVGQALVKGFDEDFSGLYLRELILRRPRFGIGLRMLYDMVRSSTEPMGYRGWTGRDMPGALFAYHENAILPFGKSETRVDHLVVVSALVPHHEMTATQEAPH